jgi:hypothetical protein
MYVSIDERLRLALIDRLTEACFRPDQSSIIAKTHGMAA